VEWGGEERGGRRERGKREGWKRERGEEEGKKGDSGTEKRNRKGDEIRQLMGC